MHNDEFSSPTVTNCIFRGDEPNEIVNYNNSNPTVTYSNVDGGWADANNTNIDADPCFVDADNPDPDLHDLRLKPDSPCIDAGNGMPLVDAGISQDLDGSNRFIDIVTLPNTGVAPFEFVDMGAYEFQLCRIPGDINCDGVVDFRDVAILCGNWLEGAEP
jgi:hypothetical protein